MLFNKSIPLLPREAPLEVLPPLALHGLEGLNVPSLLLTSDMLGQSTIDSPDSEKGEE